MTIWLTGLSGSGKSTLARGIAAQIRGFSLVPVILDGDDLRQTICRDLGFSKRDRDENIRRIGSLAHLLNRQSIIVIVAAISPYRAARDNVRKEIDRFLEVFVDCSLQTLIQRDPKGLYKRALAGEIPNFSGISDPYEAPVAPDVYVNSALQSEAQCLSAIFNKLEELQWLPPAPLPSAIEAISQAGAVDCGSTLGCRSRSLGIVDKAVLLVNERYMDPELSLERASKILRVPDRYLGRTFRAHTVKTFRTYLRQVRLDHAVWMLTHSSDGVKAISAMVGYNDPSHFTEYFREAYGLSPAQFRARRISPRACVTDSGSSEPSAR
jgi:adenylylsulfate kinase